MVDLDQSLRPIATVAPPPVSEIVARVEKRKRRRQISMTGLVVATTCVAAVAIIRLPDPSSSTAAVADIDESTSTTADVVVAEATDPPDTTPSTSSSTASVADSSTPTQTPTQTQTPSTAPEPGRGTSVPGAAGPVTSPGIRTDATTTSQWATGYCKQFEVINDGSDQTRWQVVLELNGTIAELWNAAAVDIGGGTYVISGAEGYNTIVEPGSITSFGTCVDTNTP